MQSLRHAVQVARSARPPPSVLVILGGDRSRELAVARAAVCLPTVTLVVLSSGAASEEELQSAIGDRHVNVMVDRTAVDTVTNFTTLAEGLAAAGVDAVVVGTSASHARRAVAVGRIVLGAVGVHLVHMVSVPEGSAGGDEAWWRLVRDVLRALLWALVGVHGGSVTGYVHPARVMAVRAWRECRRTMTFPARRLTMALR